MRNRAGGSDNPGPMNCDSVRDELSAELDGEQSVQSSAQAADHLTGCADCRKWQDAAHQVTRRVRLTSARAIPDRAPQILEAVLADRAAHRRPDRSRLLARAGLAALAAVQLVLLLPSLVLGHAGIGIPLHASRELGAFNLALAVGFAAAAQRPVRARGMLSVVGAATAALVLLAVVDSAYDETTLLAELPHVVAVAGWLLLRTLARTDQHDSDGSDPTRQHPRGRRWPSAWRRPFAGVGGMLAGIAETTFPPARARSDVSPDIEPHPTIYAVRDPGRTDDAAA